MADYKLTLTPPDAEGLRAFRLTYFDRTPTTKARYSCAQHAGVKVKFWIAWEAGNGNIPAKNWVRLLENCHLINYVQDTK